MEGRVRTWFPWLALVLVVVGALVWAARPDGDDATAARVNRLAGDLRCPDCQAQSVRDSSTSSAAAIKADLRERVDAGQGDAEIRKAYVERFGESILLTPEGRGLGLLVWGLPAALLVLGGGGLAVTLLRWRHEPRLTATEADERLVHGEP